ncbi:gypsy retrotransposon integrase-like protein, partial [Trifolium medium]|nr:gypsy retrotransposon integrase-like protein [Trifolium medium]
TPQTNGQAEAVNRVILRGLKRRLDEANGNWAEELHHVLWAYRTTPHSTIGETPFRLTYGTEVVIPVELNELSWRTAYPLQEQNNSRALREELDVIDETRNFATIAESVVKKTSAQRYNKRLVPKRV